MAALPSSGGGDVTIPLNAVQRQRLLVLQAHIDQLTALRSERIGAIIAEYGPLDGTVSLSPDGSAIVVTPPAEPPVTPATQAASEEGQSMTA